MKGGRVVVGEEVVEKVRDGGREEEEEGEGEEEDERENVEVTRVCFDDDLSFRNEVPKAFLGGHIGRGEEQGSEVARIALILFVSKYILPFILIVILFIIDL